MTVAAELPLLIPAIALIVTALLRETRPIAAVARASAVLLWAFAVWALIVRPLGLWDPLALWFVLLVAVLAGFCLFVSAQYVEAEVASGELTPAQARRYFLLFQGCVVSLLAIGASADYFVIWAGVEGTTLTTVLLVAMPGERAIEAAWKYIVVTGIGGLLALLGTVFVLYGAGLPLAVMGFHTAPAPVAGGAALAVEIGFWLALIGYGSKAGLVPFHTWLPDAHSEAPAPVSAILSGVKLAGGIYALLRLLALTDSAVGPLWPHRILIAVGLVSLGLAAGAIAGQRDLKRLLAYSSIEHMGLIVLGAGFGGLALAGALLHMWTHGLGKTSLFFGSGNVKLRYHSTSAPAVRGVLASMPLTGAALGLGAIAIVGLPPFGLFWSEWLLLLGGIRAGYAVWVAVAIALLLAAFLGFGLRLPPLLLGSPPAASAPDERPRREGWRPVWAIGLELAALAVVGLALPAALHSVWLDAVRLGGG
jgi:hydrogenase-4 component F